MFQVPTVAKAWSYPSTAHVASGFSERLKKEVPMYLAIQSPIKNLLPKCLVETGQTKHNRHISIIRPSRQRAIVASRRNETSIKLTPFNRDRVRVSKA